MSTSFEIGDYVEQQCWNTEAHRADPEAREFAIEMRITEITDGTAFAECPDCGALNEP